MTEPLNHLRTKLRFDPVFKYSNIRLLFYSNTDRFCKWLIFNQKDVKIEDFPFPSLTVTKSK